MDTWREVERGEIVTMWLRRLVVGVTQGANGGGDKRAGVVGIAGRCVEKGETIGSLTLEPPHRFRTLLDRGSAKRAIGCQPIQVADQIEDGASAVTGAQAVGEQRLCSSRGGGRKDIITWEKRVDERGKRSRSVLR